MRAKDLTQEQLEWFRDNFDHTKNQELADHLGTSPRCVTRMARELGLWKTKEFVAAMQRNASEHGARTNRLMGGNAGAVNLIKYGKATRFKPGTTQRDRMSPEAYEAMLVKRGAARKELFKKERRRVVFGLEQKTNLRVVQCPREKVLDYYEWDNVGKLFDKLLKGEVKVERLDSIVISSLTYDNTGHIIEVRNPVSGECLKAPEDCFITSEIEETGALAGTLDFSFQIENTICSVE